MACSEWEPLNSCNVAFRKHARYVQISITVFEFENFIPRLILAGRFANFGVRTSRATSLVFLGKIESEAKGTLVLEVSLSFLLY